MHNDLTQKDLEMMKAELDHRRLELRPQLLEEVKTARAFGDLSENFEYKAAKQEKNRNESRIRYLENMIRTAHVISQGEGSGVQLFDLVTLYLEEDDEEQQVRVVTTMRQNALRGLLSNESPMGKALLGRQVGERFYVQVSKTYGYYAVVRALSPGRDDGCVPLTGF